MKYFLFLLAFVVPAAFGSKCSKSDPKLERCLLGKVQTMRDDLMNGKSNFLPALDPFRIDNFDTTYSGADVSMFNFEVEGARNFEINRFSLKISDKYYVLNANIIVPKLTIKAFYKFVKQILIYEHVERGLFRGAFYRIKAALNVNVKPIKKLGKTYLQPEYISVHLYFDNGHVSLNGGFMGSIAESSFARNKRSVLKELGSKIKPMIREYIEDALKRVPVDEVLAK